MDRAQPGIDRTQAQAAERAGVHVINHGLRPCRAVVAPRAHGVRDDGLDRVLTIRVCGDVERAARSVVDRDCDDLPRGVPPHPHGPTEVCLVVAASTERIDAAPEVPARRVPGEGVTGATCDGVEVGPDLRPLGGRVRHAQVTAQARMISDVTPRTEPAAGPVVVGVARHRIGRVGLHVSRIPARRWVEGDLRPEMARRRPDLS